MGISQYCLNSTVERSFRSSHTEIISAKNITFPSSYCTNEAINVKGPINGAASSTPSLNDQDQTQDVAAIKIQAIFRGHRVISPTHYTFFLKKSSIIILLTVVFPLYFDAVSNNWKLSNIDK